MILLDGILKGIESTRVNININNVKKLCKRHCLQVRNSA